MRSNDEFDQIVEMIAAARVRAVAAVNTALIDLYWSIGEYIGKKIQKDGWGEGTVEELASYIHKRQPNTRVFGPESLADDAILRDLPSPAKTVTTGARIVMESQFGHFEPVQEP